MRRRLTLDLLGLAFGVLCWPALAPAGAVSAAPSSPHLPAGPGATTQVAALLGAVPGLARPLASVVAQWLGFLLLVVAAVIGYGAWRYLPRASPARALALGCAPAAVLAGTYLLLTGRDTGQGTDPPPPPTAILRPVPADAASLARGQAFFAANCVACHGPQGRGDGPLAATLRPRPANLGDAHMTGHRDADLYAFISNGVVVRGKWLFRALG